MRMPSIAEAMLAVAYDEDGPPIARVLARLETIANHVVLKNTNQHLVDEDKRKANSQNPFALMFSA